MFNALASLLLYKIVIDISKVLILYTLGAKKYLFT